MQTDRRLVEHVQDPHQARTDLGGEPDTLRLTTGQGGRGAGERQVLEADIEQEAETRLDLLEHLTGDGRLAPAQVSEFRKSAQSQIDSSLTSAIDFPALPRAG